MRYVPQTARRYTIFVCLSLLTFLMNFSNKVYGNNYPANSDFLLEVICPDPIGGSFECLDDVPVAANDSLSFVSLPGASIPSSSSEITVSAQDIVSTNSGCLDDPITITRIYTISNADMDSEICTQTIIVEQTTSLELVCNNIVVFIG